jgi:hypothetical protein
MINKFQRDFAGLESGGSDPEIKISPVQTVTIKSKTPLFKGEEQANSIEKIELEEYGFSLVAQKDLYQVGDKAVYIQPDYSLSDIPLFESFIRPFGDPKKSKLGSNFRIRAVKFNLHTGDDEPTYSVGILMPTKEVNDYLDSIKWPLIDLDLTKALGITKWEEPDNTNEPGMKTKGGSNYPSGIYKTDETNLNALWKHLENKIGYPMTLVGSMKVDGSSISIIFKGGKVTVGSRSLIKQLRINKIVGVRDATILERLRKFFTGFVPDLRVFEEADNDDQFVTLAMPYIDKVISYFGGDSTKVPDMILRGEANGQSWKGSGNKNNPTSKETPNIKFFGVDDYSSGVSVKMSDESFDNLMNSLGFERCKIIFKQQFKSREEIEKSCKVYFKTNMIEGIVLRTEDSTFSGKFMNDEYDSKK